MANDFYQEQMEDDSSANEEQEWVYHSLHEVDEIIKKYGIKFFIDNLSNYSKIAVISHLRKKEC